MEMFATADPVLAERALRAGLLNHLVPEAELEAFTYAMARRIAENAPLSVASAKQQLRGIGDGALAAVRGQCSALHEGRAEPRSERRLCRGAGRVSREAHAAISPGR